MRFSTIAAISTPRGKGGVALIRVSGPLSKTVADRVLKPAASRAFSSFSPRCAVYCEILSPKDGRVIDDGIATFFAAPHSFTGEDVVEIGCHGGETVSLLVLQACLDAGCVMAGPGEFSRRALMNGKLSLTAAEGIADLLDAKTEEGAILASAAARGKLSEKLTDVSERLLAAAASLWAYLDYPEEDLQSFSDDALCEELRSIREEVDALIATFRTGRAVSQGVKTLIVGKPNVGKSTFFNLLVGEDRAIVTDIPGTTRDLIELPVRAGKVLLNLIDTAGLRSFTEDTVEKIGMEKVEEELKSAELVFALFDPSRPFDRDDESLITMLKNSEAAVFPVLNKKDLPALWGKEKIAALGGEAVSLSAADPESCKIIFERVEKDFIPDEKRLYSGAVITNLRQKARLENLSENLSEAVGHIRSGAKDLASLDLENAVAQLNEADGKGASERILDEVFSRFCVGK